MVTQEERNILSGGQIDDGSSSFTEDDSGSLSEEEAIERASSRRRRSGDSGEDEVDVVTDPDAGDDSTRQLKSDADSDPLREVTEDDGGSLSEEERLEREASQARQREVEQNTTTRREEFGDVGSVTGPEDTTPTDSGGTAPTPTDVESDTSGGAGGPLDDSLSSGSGPEPGDVDESGGSDGFNDGSGNLTDYSELSPADQQRVNQSIQGVPEVGRGILDAEDFAVQTTEDESGEEIRTIVLGESGRRDLAAREIRRRGDVDRFDPDQDLIRVAPGAYEATVGVEGQDIITGIAFTDQGAQTLSERQRNRFREEAAQEFSQDYNTDISPEDVSVQIQDGQLSAGLTAEATGRLTGPAETTRREEFGGVGGAPETTTRAEEFGDIGRAELPREVRQNIDRGVEQSIGEARAVSLGISPSLLSDENLRALGGDLEAGRDYEVTGSTEQGYSARLVPSAEEELQAEFAERSIEGQTGADLRRSDIEITEDTTRFEQFGNVGSITQSGTEDIGGGPRLTESGRRRVRTSAPETYGDVEIRTARDAAPALTAVPFIGNALAAGALAAGDRVAVSDLPSDVSLQTEKFQAPAAGPGPQRTMQSERVTGVSVDTFAEGTTVEEALIAAEMEYSDFAGDVAQANVERNPFAAGVVDLAGRFGYRNEAEVAVEAGTGAAVQFGNLPGLALTGKEAAEFVGFASREVAEGREGIDVDVGRAADMDESVIRFDDTGLAPRLAGDAESAARGAYQYASDNPFEFGGAAVGSLAASALIMGGAASVSRTAGTASRFVIQPGEELLGYGGNLATRRVAGARTAERLFPNNEPLIFSEEAAIRGGRRAAAGASELGNRIRSRIPAVERPSASSIRTEIRSAPINLAAARYNLGRRLSGESTSFRQRSVRGELEAADIDDIELDEIDIPTRGGGEFTASGGSTRVGGTFDLERRTDSGVVIEQARFETRSEAFGEPTAELEGEFEFEQGVRPETNIEPLGLMAESTGVQSPIANEAFAEGLMESVGPRSGLEIGQPLGLETITSQEMASEVVSPIDLRFESGAEARQELLFEAELEQELEAELEFASPIETELEIEGDDFGEPRRPRRPAPDVPPWARTLERDLINPFTGE